MTQQQAKELLPIITAFAEKRLIQVRQADGNWIDSASLSPEIAFTLSPDRYRIKPEPRKFWIARKVGSPTIVCDTRPNSLVDFEIIPVIEIL